MSFRAVAWAWDQRQLTPMERLTLLALTQFANSETESCWPRVRTLADEAGISESSANRALKVLEETGLIFVERRYREDGSARSSVYSLRLPGVTVKPGGGVTVTPGDALKAEEEPYHVTPLSNENPTTKQPGAASPSGFLFRQILDKPDTPVETSEKKNGSQKRDAVPKPEPIDESYIQEMVTLFSERLGGNERVRSVIERALIHPALTTKKTTNPRIRLKHWLEDQIKFDSGKKPGNGYQPNFDQGSQNGPLYDAVVLESKEYQRRVIEEMDAEDAAKREEELHAEI